MPVAALVLGIVGLLLSLVPCLGMWALPLTLLAIIFGALGLKKEEGKEKKGKGMAIAGLICGIIGSLIASWWIYAIFALKGELNDPNSEFNQGVQQMQKEFQKEFKKELEKELERHPTAPE